MVKIITGGRKARAKIRVAEIPHATSGRAETILWLFDSERL
jgi:hypothetical protein